MMIGWLMIEDWCITSVWHDFYLSSSIDVTSRRGTPRMPSRLWKSMNQRWGRCIAWTARLSRGSKQETLFRETSWRWQVSCDYTQGGSYCHSARLIHAVSTSRGLSSLSPSCLCAATVMRTHSSTAFAFHSWVWKHYWNILNYIT